MDKSLSFLKIPHSSSYPLSKKIIKALKVECTKYKTKHSLVRALISLCYGVTKSAFPPSQMIQSLSPLSQKRQTPCGSTEPFDTEI
ncbi:hypothetical protein D3C73_1293440 [compost metagenome]